MKTNVYTDGNGSNRILVQGMGEYIPLAELLMSEEKRVALESLIVALQERASLYLQPDGESDKDFINYIIGVIDGPDQRKAQGKGGAA